MSRTFEFDGEKYKKASRHQKEWGSSLIEELSLRGDEKILDLGCGDGALTEQLSELVPDGKVVGIDASAGMIAAAQSRSKPNLTFVQMDMNDMDFQKEFEWPWYMPSREDYAKIVAAFGFSSCNISEVNRDRFFSDADEMIRWIDQPSIVPFVRALPEGVREKFRDEVVRAMLDRTLQADGTCFETFRRIHVRADK